MWVLLTFVAALVLIYLEFFLPGGALGVLGTISLVASIVLGFVLYSPATGMLIMVGELCAGAVALAYGLKLFPHTRTGKRMILSTALGADEGYVGATAGLEELVGQGGTAETDLRPAGIARIDGKRIDAVADGHFVDRGTAVTVLQVEGNRVVVRPDQAALDAGGETTAS